MFGSDNFIITIGNYGATVAFYSGSGDKLKNKIFLEELNEATKEELKKIFFRNKKAKIYFLLDTIDQIYKKKSYPLVKKFDLKTIIKRDLQNDMDKDSIKNCIITNPKSAKNDGKWECLFVSSSISQVISDWLDFLSEMPNYIAGIHMLPIETFSLFKLLKNDIDKRSNRANRGRKFYCILIHNKVSGIRQIVFSEQVIVFTRIVNYDFKDQKFLEKYEHDIYSTFEYLKRLFPEIGIDNIEVINIFTEKALERIRTIGNVELNFINYTPAQVSKIIGFKDIDPDSSYCDLIISKVFSKTKKKILNFVTPKTETVQRLYNAGKAINYLNVAIFFGICVSSVGVTFIKNQTSEAFEKARQERISAIAKLSKVIAVNLEETESIENLDGAKIDRITDIGKIHEYFSIFKPEFFDIYTQFGFIKKYNTSISSFSYRIENFNKDQESRDVSYTIDVKGKIFNETGDLEKLFVGFDGLIFAAKKNFEGSQITYQELPRNVDFTKKYYDENINITVVKKGDNKPEIPNIE